MAQRFIEIYRTEVQSMPSPRAGSPMVISSGAATPQVNQRSNTPDMEIAAIMTNGDGTTPNDVIRTRDGRSASKSRSQTPHPIRGETSKRARSSPINRPSSIIDLTQENASNELYQMHQAKKNCWCTKCRNLVYASHSAWECEMNAKRSEMNRRKNSPMYGRFIPINNWTKKTTTPSRSNKDTPNQDRRNSQETSTRPESETDMFPTTSVLSPSPLTQAWSQGSTYDPEFPNLQQAFRHAKVNVEGNIGCGKTTFMKLLRTQFNADILDLPEPVQEWADPTGLNLLYHFYLKPRKWSFIFQTKVIASL